ncbi:MAG: hypothetical protein GY804_09775 [Alphaproteobacteria bacterium]|nr:hypothetical protein [Alphaproteobacteria bacterium]
MADNVIHGEGKPRFGVPTEKIWEGTNSAATSTTITLNGTPDLDGLDSEWGLVNCLVWSRTSDSPAETTHGKITAYNDSTDVLTVDSWSEGTPDTSQPTYIQHKRIDLPFCGRDRLIEGFVPDTISKKMLTGNINTNKRGFYYRAALHYVEYLHKDNMELLRDLFNKNFSHFIFYPRVDNTALFYKVDIDPKAEVSFYQLRAHQGHGGIIINIIGLTRLDKIPFIDPVQVVAGAITDADGIYVTDDFDVFVTED